MNTINFIRNFPQFFNFFFGEWIKTIGTSHKTFKVKNRFFGGLFNFIQKSIKTFSLTYVQDFLYYLEGKSFR
jgi:hypothetical protein